MWVALLVLFLWAVDKHLLSRVWAIVYTVSRKLAWSALTTYATWKHNDSGMIKDGYHVDEAFLYEYAGSTRQIDVLRVFRQQVKLATLLYNK